MRVLANTSWKTVGLIAAGWALAWLLASGISLWLSIRSLVNGSGGLAAVGGGLTLRGVIVTFGPPVALLTLRLIAARFHSSRSADDGTNDR